MEIWLWFGGLGHVGDTAFFQTRALHPSAARTPAFSFPSHAVYERGKGGNESYLLE